MANELITLEGLEEFKAKYDAKLEENIDSCIVSLTATLDSTSTYYTLAYTLGDGTSVNTGLECLSSHYADAIEEALADKQNKLVSGTNIKTINNNSILGSGNLSITANAMTSSSSYFELNISSKTGTYTLPSYNNFCYLRLYRTDSNGTAFAVSVSDNASNTLVSEDSFTYGLSLILNNGTSHMLFKYDSTNSIGTWEPYTTTPTSLTISITTTSTTATCVIYVKCVHD